MTRHMSCGGFSKEGGSPVARQVVHAGVHTVFMSSLVPTRHGGGTGWKWGRQGNCSSAL